MAEIIELENLVEGYVDLVEHVRDNGREAAPRGMPVRELRNVTVTVEDATSCVPVGVGRKLNNDILAAETAALIAGVSDLEQLKSVSAVFGNFANGLYLMGAYGPRAHAQWREALYRLHSDPDTRQAVVSIWNGTELRDRTVKDVPCTVALAFSLRDGRLDAHTFMRSNDVWLGVAYDFGMFTRAQMSLAYALGVETGSYTHTAVNLHLYERNVDATYELEKPGTTAELQAAFDAIPPAPIPDEYEPATGDFASAQSRWSSVRDAMSDAVLGRILDDDAPSGARWYADRLRPHASGGALNALTRYVTPRAR